MTTEEAVSAVVRLGLSLSGDRCCPICWATLRPVVRSGGLWYVCPCGYEAPA
jgi:hypothetical protein